MCSSSIWFAIILWHLNGFWSVTYEWFIVTTRNIEFYIIIFSTVVTFYVSLNSISAKAARAVHYRLKKIENQRPWNRQIVDSSCFFHLNTETECNFCKSKTLVIKEEISRRNLTIYVFIIVPFLFMLNQ